MPQAVRDVAVTVSYTPAPVGESVTNYIMQYALETDGIVGPQVQADFLPNAGNSTVINLVATDADFIRVALGRCNVNSCSSYAIQGQVALPPAVDPVTTPVGVSVSTVKV